MRDVRSALAVLVQHGLVTFCDKRRPGTADYTLEVWVFLAVFLIQKQGSSGSGSRGLKKVKNVK